jgi:hypothetical protein
MESQILEKKVDFDWYIPALVQAFFLAFALYSYFYLALI